MTLFINPNISLFFVGWRGGMGGGGGAGSVNKTEMVKAVTRAFCSIQKLVIGDIHTKFNST